MSEEENARLESTFNGRSNEQQGCLICYVNTKRGQFEKGLETQRLREKIFRKIQKEAREKCEALVCNRTRRRKWEITFSRFNLELGQKYGLERCMAIWVYIHWKIRKRKERKLYCEIYAKAKY